MRFKLRTLFLIVAVPAVFSAIAFYAINVNHSVRNSYAAWWVANMVVEHMQANHGRWPNNWDDLRDDYQTCVKRSGRPWQFDELKRRVKIDWNANPDDLIRKHADSEVEFRVIWLADGTRSHWAGREPNQIVLDYFNKPTE